MSQQSERDKILEDQYRIPSILIPGAFWQKYHEAWYLTINNTPVRNKRHLCYIVFNPRSYPATQSIEEQIRLEEIRCLMGE